MQSTDRDRVLVADLAAKRARLGEADMVRFAWRATANDARLRRDELAVLLVSQADGLGGDASATGDGPSGQDDRR